MGPGLDWVIEHEPAVWSVLVGVAVLVVIFELVRHLGVRKRRLREAKMREAFLGDPETLVQSAGEDVFLTTALREIMAHGDRLWRCADRQEVDPLRAAELLKLYGDPSGAEALLLAAQRDGREVGAEGEDLRSVRRVFPTSGPADPLLGST